MNNYDESKGLYTDEQHAALDPIEEATMQAMGYAPPDGWQHSRSIALAHGFNVVLDGMGFSIYKDGEKAGDSVYMFSPPAWARAAAMVQP
jgi:hypothetical protein